MTSALHCVADLLRDPVLQGAELLVTTIAAVVGVGLAWRALPKIQADMLKAADEVRRATNILVFETKSPGWMQEGVGHWKKTYPDGFVARLRFLPAIGRSATLSVAQADAARSLALQQAGTRILEIFRPNETEATWEEMLSGDLDQGLAADAKVSEKKRPP